MFDNPFVLNLCMWECCSLVNHDNGVVAQWNVFFGCNVDRMIDILNLRFMDEDDHYQLNGYMLYVGTYKQVLHMWGGKCLHELLVHMMVKWWHKVFEDGFAHECMKDWISSS